MVFAFVFLFLSSPPFFPPLFLSEESLLSAGVPSSFFVLPCDPKTVLLQEIFSSGLNNFVHKSTTFFIERFLTFLHFFLIKTRFFNVFILGVNVLFNLLPKRCKPPETHFPESQTNRPTAELHETFE